MRYIAIIFKWIFNGLSILAQFGPGLWSAVTYSSVAVGMYAGINKTISVVSGLDTIFTGWADEFTGMLSSLFLSVLDNSTFSFFAYVLSLDVLLDWFKQSADTFLRYWLTYTCGAVLVVIEVCIGVLAVFWVRNRLKMISRGVDGSGSRVGV